jgi:DNA polymerase III delta prime subunit
LRLLKWDDDALNKVVLEPNTRQLIQGVIEAQGLTSPPVASHPSLGNQAQADFMQENDRSFVILFYGPPGTGKTLSAKRQVECPPKIE